MLEIAGIVVKLAKIVRNIWKSEKVNSDSKIKHSQCRTLTEKVIMTNCTPHRVAKNDQIMEVEKLENLLHQVPGNQWVSLLIDWFISLLINLQVWLSLFTVVCSRRATISRHRFSEKSFLYCSTKTMSSPWRALVSSLIDWLINECRIRQNRRFPLTHAPTAAKSCNN